jgi:hypothetical protein
MQPNSTTDNETKPVPDESETIFDVPEEVAPLSLDSVCGQCGSCGARLVEPMLEPVAGEQYLELNDLSCWHVDNIGCLGLPNGVSDEQSLLLEPKVEQQESSGGVCNGTASATAAASGAGRGSDVV